jgi:hypothetical protein
MTELEFGVSWCEPATESEQHRGNKAPDQSLQLTGDALDGPLASAYLAA